MIFVTTGSQKFQFNRLLQKIDSLIEEGVIDQPVYAQIGYSDYQPRYMEYCDFMDQETFRRKIDECQMVITHGGTGVIIRAVKSGKKVIAVPRLQEYGEHVDDHQVQLLGQFDEMNLISSCYNLEDLGQCYKETLMKQFQTYTSNTEAVIADIEQYLSENMELKKGSKECLPKKGRIQYLDVAKGIAISLVCMGHAVTNNENVHMVSMPHVLRFISQFHMPLFFVMNGMLFSEKYIDHPFKASLHKIKAYYVPFVIYNLIFLAFHNLFAKINLVNETYHGGSYDAKQYLNRFVMVITGHRQSFGGAMWFLGSLLVISLLFIWAKYFIAKWVPLQWREACTAGIVVVFVFIGISGKCPSAFKLDVSLYSMLFFYLGYLYRKYDWNNYLVKHKQIILGIGLIFNIVIAYFSSVGVVGKSYKNFLLFVATAVTGSLMVIMFSQVKKIKNSRLLILIGQKSLDIMSLHFLAFKAVSVVVVAVYGFSWNRLAEYPVILNVGGGWWIAYTAGGIALSVAVRGLFDFGCKKLRGRKTDGAR